VHTHQPQLVFLSETRKRKDVVENLRWRLGLKHVVSYHEEGKGGGLALFWHEDLEVELFKINDRIIDVTVFDSKKGIKWRCTFVYGEPKTHMRHHMWDMLKKIKPMMNLPWLMLGDFNETMWQCEHLSKKKRNEKQMLDFREVLSHCDLHDLGFSGTPWTFDNKQKGKDNVKVRLDRAVANPSWTNIYPQSHVTHLTSSRSDHCPILLHLYQEGGGNTSARPRRYDAVWEAEASHMEGYTNCLGEVCKTT
jgi:exonuclease III